MLARAGAELGHTFRFFDRDPHACAASAGELVCGAFDDPAAIDRFCAGTGPGDGIDLATFEFENVPVETAEAVAARVPVVPSSRSLRVTQDRVAEKEWFARCAFDTAPWARVESIEDLRSAIARIGAPGVLKTRRGGYDGKGQARVRTPDDAPAAWAAIGAREAIYEAMIPFDREVSLIVARAASGDLSWCPLVENTHAGGILWVTRAPAPDVDPRIERAAREHAKRLVEDLEHVGVFTIELFQVGDRLLANETAPRVHNSGHWTIEGAPTSQFANHIRAITGAGLGPMDPAGPCAMVNLIGAIPGAVRDLREPGMVVHDYGKAPRPGRKVGHITISGRTLADTDALVARLSAIIAADDQNAIR
jgi:5-(carboxyamino)imidazole ribonucleotide synthase